MPDTSYVDTATVPSAQHLWIFHLGRPGPARQQQAHLETHKFLFFILFGAAGHGLVIWFHRNWCVVHTCRRTPGAYIPQRPEVHPRWRWWRQRLPARRERGKNISRRVLECFFELLLIFPLLYFVSLFWFFFFWFLFYFILWWGSLSLCVAFSLEIASLVEATFRLGNRPNEK